MIKLEGVEKTFRRSGNHSLGVLKNVNLEIGDTDKIAILGKSGAGKSTLLHILGTLESPTHGKVTMDGQDVFQLSEERLSKFRNQSIGFVFQFHYLMIEFTALENVMMPGLIGNLTKAQAREKASQLLEAVGLKERMEHKPNQLSGGEQQRVAIARALMNRPKLLLTDEMTGNLDPATGCQIFELIQRMYKEKPMAVVSVTHDEGLAASYPRIYRLIDGKLESVTR